MLLKRFSYRYTSKKRIREVNFLRGANRSLSSGGSRSRQAQWWSCHYWIRLVRFFLTHSVFSPKESTKIVFLDSRTGFGEFVSWNEEHTVILKNYQFSSFILFLKKRTLSFRIDVKDFILVADGWKETTGIPKWQVPGSIFPVEEVAKIFRDDAPTTTDRNLCSAEIAELREKYPAANIFRNENSFSSIRQGWANSQPVVAVCQNPKKKSSWMEKSCQRASKRRGWVQLCLDQNCSSHLALVSSDHSVMTPNFVDHLSSSTIHPTQ